MYKKVVAVMAEKPIKTPPAANLPENWTPEQTVTAEGTPTTAHAYNYLMQSVNAMLNGAAAINDAFEGIATLGAGNIIPAEQLPAVYATVMATNTVPVSAWTRAADSWRTSIAAPSAVIAAFVDINDAEASARTLNAWSAVNVVRLAGTTLELRCYSQPPVIDVPIKCCFIIRQS